MNVLSCFYLLIFTSSSVYFFPSSLTMLYRNKHSKLFLPANMIEIKGSYFRGEYINRELCLLKFILENEEICKYCWGIHTNLRLGKILSVKSRGGDGIISNLPWTKVQTSIFHWAVITSKNNHICRALCVPLQTLHFTFTVARKAGYFCVFTIIRLFELCFHQRLLLLSSKGKAWSLW